jgi:hypothetical protein
LALSPTQPGARHDYALLKAWDFPPRLPPDVVCWTDLGFQGMKTDYPHLSIIQPEKKPKGRKLDAEYLYYEIITQGLMVVVYFGVADVVAQPTQ